MNLAAFRIFWITHDLKQGEVFSTKMYISMRGLFQKMEWRRLVCNNQGMPKWTFILILALHGKLPTKNRLAKWGVVTDKICPLCNIEEKKYIPSIL